MKKTKTVYYLVSNILFPLELVTKTSPFNNNRNRIYKVYWVNLRKYKV